MNRVDKTFASRANQKQSHAWVTVVNPSNKIKLLQACDNCGVVQSENTIIASCKAQANRQLISRHLQTTFLRSA